MLTEQEDYMAPFHRPLGTHFLHNIRTFSYSMKVLATSLHIPFSQHKNPFFLLISNTKLNVDPVPGESCRHSTISLSHEK